MTFQRLLRLPARRSALLLGPRQTGKSTLVAAQLPPGAWTVDLLPSGNTQKRPVGNS